MDGARDLLFESSLGVGAVALALSSSRSRLGGLGGSPARAKWAVAGAFAAIFAWWSLIPASHERPWRPDVAVMPRAIIEGDRVRLTGVRNFEYRSRTTSRRATRSARFARAPDGVDFYISRTGCRARSATRS